MRMRIPNITSIKPLPGSPLWNANIEVEEPGNFSHTSSAKGRKVLAEINCVWAYPKT